MTSEEQTMAELTKNERKQIAEVLDRRATRLLATAMTTERTQTILAVLN